jgi:hypothetical protein
MKTLVLSLALSLFGIAAVHADDFDSVSNTYEAAKLPDFLPHVGKALPGRCFMASSSNKKIASVLMVSFEEDGFQVAPYDADKKREDIFDDMNYETVLKQFPLVKKMFLDVNETADGAVVYKESGKDEYKSEIRESEKYMIMRVYLNDKVYKNCNYIKKDN